MNSFGQIFRVTTWGESHGPAVGVVIDGCSSGLELDIQDIQEELDLRRPGIGELTSPRKETDTVEILSGVFEGKTTGTPISLIIRNRDVNSTDYEQFKDIYRPGHADFTYQKKYGIRDYRGGGRASGRETACRVAAGAVAKKLLAQYGISVLAFISRIGDVVLETPGEPWERSLSYKESDRLRRQIYNSPVRCPDKETASAMAEEISKAADSGDSVGGIIECRAYGLPVGLGDPVFGKLDALLAHAVCSIGAVKGIEFGEGFNFALLKGSRANDPFMVKDGEVIPAANKAGGILGGISTGAPLVFRTVIKPTPSIKLSQKSATINGKPSEIIIEGRHDPCIAIRAVTVIEHMVNLVLIDLLFSHFVSTFEINRANKE